MSTETIIINGPSAQYGCYTLDAWNQYVSDGGSANANMHTVDATRHTITVRVMNSVACALAYDQNGDGTFTNWSGGPRESDMRLAELVIPIYEVSGELVTVYGAHPGAESIWKTYWRTYSRANSAVVIVSADQTRYCPQGIVVDASTGEIVSDLQAGTQYDAGKITYRTTAGNGFIWFGSGVALDKTYYVYAGYYHFFRIEDMPDAAVSLMEPSSTPNARTVASDVRRALILDVEAYNSGGSGADVIAISSGGSLPTYYTSVIRQDLGDYLPSHESRFLQPFEGEDWDGNEIVLRGVSTKPDGSGMFYPVGSDLSGILTRRPSLTAYDTFVNLYASWMHRYEITVVANGGSGVAEFFYSPETGRFYSESGLMDETETISPLTKPGAVFLGLYDGDSVSATKVVSDSGSFVDGWAPSGDIAIYAQWRTVVSVTLDMGDGVGADSAIVYDSAVGGYVMPGGSALISSIVPPEKLGFQFTGYFTASTGGAQMIGADGALLAAMTDSPPAAAFTLYAQYARVAFILTLHDGDALSRLFNDGETAIYYATIPLEVAVDSVAVPDKTGHEFLGYFSEEGGSGTQAIDESGNLLLSSALSSDGDIYAYLAPRVCTITFDYAGGTGSEASRDVTWGESVGTLPTPASAPSENVTFAGWFVGQSLISSGDVWDVDGDAVAVARWSNGFGDVTDYFGIGSDSLVPFFSESGDSRQRLAVSHYGRHGADEMSGIWRNPVVKYMVVRDTAVLLRLGAGFRASRENGVDVSGYMITSVTAETAVGMFPVVTVQGSANEGADAVNSFLVAIGISARAKAQNLLSAVSGGGELERLSLTARCDPVVAVMNMMPCASDVVRGVFEVAAETLAHERQSAPEASGGFVSVGAPAVRGGTDRWRYSIVARKEMV